MNGRIIDWWDGREPRERVLLSVLGAIVAIFIVIFGLILPLQSARANADASLNRAQADLVAVSRLSSSDATTTRLPFDRSVLIQNVNGADIKLTRVQPGSDGTLSVWIDDAQTQRLYGFFETLLSDYAVGLDQVIVSTDANGRLSTQFVVR